jgi:hypothetical protein
MFEVILGPSGDFRRILKVSSASAVLSAPTNSTVWWGGAGQITRNIDCFFPLRVVGAIYMMYDSSDTLLEYLDLERGYAFGRRYVL